MKRLGIFAAGISIGLAAAMASGQEIETFDSPNQTQNGNGNFAFAAPDGGAWNPSTITDNPTNVTISWASGYGTVYHNIYNQDTPQAVNASGSSTLQADITINSGDSGLFVDLQDGEGDFWQYTWGYGLTGIAANDQGGLPAGYSITQGSAPNELILDAPFASPTNNNGSPTFDTSAIVLFRLEDDPGAGVNDSISFNDLSGVNVPEPASFGIGTLACVFFARRRRR